MYGFYPLLAIKGKATSECEVDSKPLMKTFKLIIPKFLLPYYTWVFRCFPFYNTSFVPPKQFYPIYVHAKTNENPLIRVCVRVCTHILQKGWMVGWMMAWIPYGRKNRMIYKSNRVAHSFFLPFMLTTMLSI